MRTWIASQPESGSTWWYCNVKRIGFSKGPIFPERQSPADPVHHKLGVDGHNGNTLLSAGASSAMLHSLEDLSDFTQHAHALFINIGTLSPHWLSSKNSAAALASSLRIPWVFDPVAASASDFWLRACLELLRMKPTVVRGNVSEVMALATASKGIQKS